MSTTFNVMITGVGGQGILTVSKVVALAASGKHQFVSRTESRGLSQRGGIVSSEVRFGDKSVAPVIGLGDADLILALDALEAGRAIPYLKPNGTLLTNEEMIVPVHLQVLWRERDKEQENTDRLKGLVFTRIRDKKIRVLMIDLKTIAKDASWSAGLNCVMLGALSVFLPFDADCVSEALAQCISSREALKAFADGRYFMLKHFIDNGPTFDTANPN